MAGRAAPVHVLIVGGGVAALEATLALRAHAEERVAITLVAPDEQRALALLEKSVGVQLELDRNV